MDQFFVDYMERLQALTRDFVAAFDDLPDEALDWVPGDEMNSFCVLVVHTAGAGRFWIGVALDEPPARDRDAEFQAQGLSKVELKAHFANFESCARDALARISYADLAAARTVKRRDGTAWNVTAGWALLHALEHTGLHLGHAQITRQLWERR